MCKNSAADVAVMEWIKMPEDDADEKLVLCLPSALIAERYCSVRIFPSQF